MSSPKYWDSFYSTSHMPMVLCAVSSGARFDSLSDNLEDRLGD